MDSDKGMSPTVKIEKLTDENFHVWRQKIDLLLTYREGDHVISTRNPYEMGTSDYKTWVQHDKIARAIIGLSISDDMLEHIRGLDTAKDMLDSIVNVFQRHTLLNKLRARREFYTAAMQPEEKILTFINRVRHLSSILQSMGVEIGDEEEAMAVLNGLPHQYGSIIAALDAVGDTTTFTLEFVKSRLLQEEQRKRERESSNQPDTVLINEASKRTKRIPRCHYCGRRGHTQDNCWDKYPEKRPQRNKMDRPSSNTRALAVEDSSSQSSPSEENSFLLVFRTRQFRRFKIIHISHRF